MDKKKLDITIKKINRLYELISNIGEPSSTEIDLLKAYTLELYEAVSMDDFVDVVDRDIEDMKKKLKKQKKQEKKLRKEIDRKNGITEHEAITHSAAVQESPRDVERVVRTTSAAAPVAAATAQPTIARPAAPKTESNSPELEELFKEESSNELSERLSQSPITDLTKAMSINEKIFTVNELFGGNQDEFTNMLTALNGLSTYSEAKSVLIRSVAMKYKWSEAGKYNKAKTFIKLVQRRYK